MALLLVFATLAVMALMSAIGARRIAPGKARLTMQWGLDGKPNWSLPRPLALAFIPAVAAILLSALAFGGETFGTMLPASAAFIGMHALHLALLARRGG
ncbi:MAG: hypothetical protein J0H80_21315 [Rhizobiales bacterium]|nr:hypothetical protein [Hyphomicrobiales bacterium]